MKSTTEVSRFLLSTYLDVGLSGLGRRHVLSCEEKISVEVEAAGEFPDGSATTVQRSNQNFSRLLVSRFCRWIVKEFLPACLKHSPWSTNLPLA